MNLETKASISIDPMNASPVTVKRRSDSEHCCNARRVEAIWPVRLVHSGFLCGFCVFLRSGFEWSYSGVFLSCTSKPCSLERIGSHLSATFDVLTSKKALPYDTTLYWTNPIKQVTERNWGRV